MTIRALSCAAALGQKRTLVTRVRTSYGDRPDLKYTLVSDVLATILGIKTKCSEYNYGLSVSKLKIKFGQHLKRNGLLKFQFLSRVFINKERRLVGVPEQIPGD